MPYTISDVCKASGKNFWDDDDYGRNLLAISWDTNNVEYLKSNRNF